MNELKPLNIGVPLLYESYYPFNTNVMLNKSQNLFSTIDYKKYNDFLELGESGTSAITKNEGPHTWVEMSDFNYWATNHAANILNQWGFKFNQLKIDSSWVNCHWPGGWTNFHTHSFSNLSLVAYINAPEKSGNLLIIDPMENHWHGFPTSRNMRMGDGQPIPVEKNKVIFFAPFLRHGTEKNMSDQERWVISMNISIV